MTKVRKPRQRKHFLHTGELTGRPQGAPLRHVDPVEATLVVALLRRPASLFRERAGREFANAPLSESLGDGERNVTAALSYPSSRERSEWRGGWREAPGGGCFPALHFSFYVVLRPPPATSVAARSMRHPERASLVSTPNFAVARGGEGRVTRPRQIQQSKSKPSASASLRASAKQSIARQIQSWIASSQVLLAMTTHTSAFPRVASTTTSENLRDSAQASDVRLIAESPPRDVV